VSVRSYAWADSGSRRSRHPSTVAAALPLVLAAVTVLLQIAYPLTSGANRTDLTVVTVVAFFLTSAVHALVWRGALWTAGYLAITLGGGLLVEAVGSSTGFPFGDYAYSHSLGAQVLGVPWVIPLAWAMMAYPALLVGQRLVRSPLLVPLVAGLALASWDLFLDPMMVADGHWSWSNVDRIVPGIHGIPAVNFAGWLVVSIVLTGLLTLLPRVIADDRVPIGMWLWTYVSSVLANAVFLDRPTVALVGGIVMGIVAVPLAFTLWVDRP